MLYVTADDLGARLGVYGHPYVRSPRIDAFAGESLLFERCYCQIATCGASRTSILTGIRPETSGIVTNDHDWQATLPGAVSLVRRFRDAGYRTYGMGKINDTRGGDLDDAWTVAHTEQGGITDTVGARRLMTTVARDDNPFFLALGFRQPHCPWEPTDESIAEYAGVDIPPEGPGRKLPGECEEVDRILDDERAAEFARRYYAAVTDVDTMFGEILDTAEDLDMLENTIVIFWSGDHGYSLGENNHWGKWSNYDASTRIPLLMKIPGSESQGERSPALVEAVDMYPTLVELCDLPEPPQSLEGFSFVPLFGDPMRPWKSAAFSMFGYQKSIKTQRYNLISVNRPYDQYNELFDLEADPEEENDLAASRPDLVDELFAKLVAGPTAALPPS